MIKYIYILLIIISPVITFGQYSTSGSANQTTCNCFELTNSGATNTIGSFNQNLSIDLNNSFNYKFTVNFGCDNNGGEGIAFVLQTGPWSIGNNSYGLGYEGLSNSLAIEFDTRDSQSNGDYPAGLDIPADHISIQTNGVIDHNSANNLGPFPTPNIKPGVANIEDCDDHTIEIIWVSGAQTLEVLVDGLSSFGGPVAVGDIINTIFGGNPNVLWGWTGTTDVLTNTQTVCLGLEPQFTYSATNCPNQLINFSGSSWSFNNILLYSWDFDGMGTSLLQNPSFTFVTAGNHPVTLTITDDAGCSNTQTFDVGIGFDVTISADDLTICPNGSTQLQVIAMPFTGNDCCFDLILTDLWDDGWAGNFVEVFVDGTSFGTFSPAVNGMGQAYLETHQLCFNQDAAIDIIINGDAFPGECSYELVDQNGITVLQVLNGNGVWVDGDTQSFTVDCGITPPVYTYNWDNAGLLDNATIQNPTVTNLPSTTTFTVQVTDPNTGCTIPQSITINTSPTVTATLSGNATICDGDTGDLTITFTGPAPYDFQVLDPLGTPINQNGINTSPYTFPVGVDGTYTMVSVSGNGCVGTVSGTGDITVIIPPVVDIEVTASYCDGDVINAINVVSANGGTVNWYTDVNLVGTPIFVGNSYTPPSIIGSTIYYAQEVEGVLGCGGAADNVTITVNPIPPAPSLSGDTIYCDNEVPTPLSAEMSLAGTASWYDNITLTPPIVSPLLQYNPTLNIGTFCYYVTETANGCTGPAAEICVLTKPTPNPPVITGETTYCEGETPTPLTATPNMAGVIDWYNAGLSNIGSGTAFTPNLLLGSQTYSATETLDGCISDPEFVSITVNQLPTVDIPETASICFGDSVLITAQNNGFDLAWSNGDTGSTSWLSPWQTDTVYITATNPLCGFITDSIIVTVYSLPLVTAGNDTVIGIGGEVNLWASGTSTFIWTPEPDRCTVPNCSQVYVIPNQATLYIVEGTDLNGCHNYDTVLVDVSGYMEVFVPNIFSPNGDGYNDYLIIEGPRLFDFKIDVFDRWGKLVFTSYDQKDSWNGKLQGESLAPQTFVYMIRGETVLGEVVKQSGNVTIIK
jgi:gliding motility-associated-like protein